MVYGPLANSALVDILSQVPRMTSRIEVLREAVSELSAELSCLSRVVSQARTVTHVHDGVALERRGTEHDGRVYAAGNDISRAATVRQDADSALWVIDTAEVEWRWQGSRVVVLRCTAEQAWQRACDWVAFGHPVPDTAPLTAKSQPDQAHGSDLSDPSGALRPSAHRQL